MRIRNTVVRFATIILCAILTVSIGLIIPLNNSDINADPSITLENERWPGGGNIEYSVANMDSSKEQVTFTISFNKGVKLSVWGGSSFTKINDKQYMITTDKYNSSGGMTFTYTGDSNEVYASVSDIISIVFAKPGDDKGPGGKDGGPGGPGGPGAQGKPGDKKDETEADNKPGGPDANKPVKDDDKDKAPKEDPKKKQEEENVQPEPVVNTEPVAEPIIEPVVEDTSSDTPTTQEQTVVATPVPTNDNSGTQTNSNSKVSSDVISNTSDSSNSGVTDSSSSKVIEPAIGVDGGEGEAADLQVNEVVAGLEVNGDNESIDSEPVGGLTNGNASSSGTNSGITGSGENVTGEATPTPTIVVMPISATVNKNGKSTFDWRLLIGALLVIAIAARIIYLKKHDVDNDELLVRFFPIDTIKSKLHPIGGAAGVGSTASVVKESEPEPVVVNGYLKKSNTAPIRPVYSNVTSDTMSKRNDPTSRVRTTTIASTTTTASSTNSQQKHEVKVFNQAAAMKELYAMEKMDESSITPESPKTSKSSSEGSFGGMMNKIKKLR